MIRNRTHLAIAAALVASLAVVGCKKKEEPAVVTPPPVAAEPAPMPAPMTATASITGVDLGNAVGADMKVTAPTTTFKPTDTIFAAISTSTSDPAATVASKLGAKWSYQDGQTVNEETADVNLTGAGVTNFKISKPDGFPTGKYKLEVSQDGAVVQTREFEVQ